MSTTTITMGIALLMAIGLVVNLGVLSLLSGTFYFLFGKPSLGLLKSQLGETGFAFSLKWNEAREPAKFDRVRVRLFNPFSTPTQVEVSHEFAAAGSSFAKDLDFGPGMKNLITAIGKENSRVMVEVSALKDGINHQFEMTGAKFLKKLREASLTAEQFNEENKVESSKPLYTIPKKTFVAEPLPKSGKALKIATNPEFAGEFSEAGGAGEAAKENFAVSKVWIEDGCIVCDACEGIYPEVFEVTAETCVIRDGAPLDDGLKIMEAAEACPVEVIKFNKA